MVSAFETFVGTTDDDEHRNRDALIFTNTRKRSLFWSSKRMKKSVDFSKPALPVRRKIVIPTNAGYLKVGLSKKKYRPGHGRKLLQRAGELARRERLHRDGFGFEIGNDNEPP